MDQELIAYLDQRFRETSQQIEGFREETTSSLEAVKGRLDGLEEGVRYTQITLEGMRGEIRLVAEGIMGLDERLGFLREDMSQKIDEADSFLRLSYADMDRHIKESDKFFRASLAELNARIRPIEGWQERYGRDPVAL